jgi:SAM-dependent methyltransferase
VTGATATVVAAPERERDRDRGVIILFASTAFVGAGLLFLVQPMVARLLLPLYGGSATVWSTSSLFFQVVLLAGYLYTDRTTSLLSRGAQRRLHVVVMLLPLLLLPLALPGNAAPPDDLSPVLWLLRTLLVVVGFPFLVLATTGPLVQKWYSWSGRHRAGDPYFLFAASNLGSFVGLLSYPFLIEPVLRLETQLRLWSVLFVLFVVLTGTCLTIPLRGGARSGAQAEAAPRPAVPRPSRLRVARWAAWAFLPSALMLAVTSHVSTDIAAIPLLWVVPLSIYLATFVIAFSHTGRTPPVTAARVAVGLALLAAVGSYSTGLAPVWAMVLIQVVMLAAVAYAAHGHLAADRPDPQHLTGFYLVVAVGGALGGLLNGVVAPLMFDRVLEYAFLVAAVPLLLVGAQGRRPQADPVRSRRHRTRLLGVAVAVTVPVAVIAPFISERRDLAAAVLLVPLVAVALVLPLYPRISVVAIALVVAVPMAIDSRDVMDHRRTFYGSYAVTGDDEAHRLRHGTTLHGLQFLDERRGEPTTYYAPTGPLGDVLTEPSLVDVAVVGLGVGTVAAYGEPGQRYTFYEIDDEVVDIAADPSLFTYLRDTKADVRTVVGDGRLRLAEEPAESFDVIVLDAFSSDAIPVHLLTAEALAEYLTRLRPGGTIAVHISNRVFDLRPVLRGAADTLGLDALVSEKTGGEGAGATASTWVVLGSEGSLSRLQGQPGWTSLPETSVEWTDDFSSLLAVLRW